MSTSFEQQPASNACVNLLGAATRGIEEQDLAQLLQASFKEDPLHTLRIIAYVRDCRGGKGERHLGRLALKWLAENHAEELKHNLKHFVGEYGRFDDVAVLMNTPAENDGLDLLQRQLEEDLERLNADAEGDVKISMCAKWIPSEKKSLDNKLNVNRKLCRQMKLTQAQLRKTYLSPLRKHLDIVERRMCANDWGGIDFDKVPKEALRLNRNAFSSNIHDKFWKWRAQSGDSKLGALYPHEIVSEYFSRSSVEDVIEAQWSVLSEYPGYHCSASTSLTLACLSDSSERRSSVALSVLVATLGGLLVPSFDSEDLEGLVLAFDNEPQFHHEQGDPLFERVKQLEGAPESGQRAIAAAYRAILELAKQYSPSSERLPERLIVVSDMELASVDPDFDARFALLEREFAAADCQAPALVFWNVRGSSMDVRQYAGSARASLVSGFSASIVQRVLSGRAPSALERLQEVAESARYGRISLPGRAQESQGRA